MSTFSPRLLKYISDARSCGTSRFIRVVDLQGALFPDPVLATRGTESEDLEMCLTLINETVTSDIACHMLYRLDSVGYFKEVAEDVFEGYRFVIMTFVPHNSKPEYSLFLSKRHHALKQVVGGVQVGGKPPIVKDFDASYILQGQSAAVISFKESPDLGPLQMDDRSLTPILMDRYRQLEYRQRDFVQKLKESDFSAAMDLLNTDRNRYTNILPLDKTRVILSDGIGTDYINANWVKDMQGKARYIASQAPLDFWRMCVLYKVKNIVMLCGLVEDGKSKCHQYWDVVSPIQQSKMTVGMVSATRISAVEMTPVLIKREIEVCLYKESPDKTNGSREYNKKWFSPVATTRVSQLQFTGWGDFGVIKPQNIMDILETMSDDGPFVIHCSAGVGRTGTMICADMIRRKVKSCSSSEKMKIDVDEIVKSVRMDRVGSVQTAQQYILLHTFAEYCGILNGVDVVTLK